MTSVNLPSSFNIGVDIIKISRLEKRLHDQRFLHRVFKEDELKAFGNDRRRLTRLASRWAAKEAVAKALGCGIGEELAWKDIEVIDDEKGRPHVQLSPKAAQFHKHPRFAVSISHDGDYAIAVVLCLENK